MKGLANDDAVQLAPITILPSPFPRSAFQLAKSIQTDVNLLTHRTAYNYKFLSETLERTIQVDPFTSNLFKVYEKVLKDGTAQPNSFGLLRADYMMHEQEAQVSIKQVEVNVIAAGFAIMGPKLSRCHQYTVSKYCPSASLDNLPANLADDNFARSFIKAFDSYGNSNAIILVVIEDRTINISDQRSMDINIAKFRPDIKIIKRNFVQLLDTAKLKDNQLLFIDNQNEVALVYYRYGYDPSHYPSQEYWDLRLLIEKSRALKCPSIFYHLAGVKKVQQALNTQEKIEQFLSPKSAERVFRTCAGLWGLERDEEGDQVVDMVLSDPERYVMKPQREGGGNNIYGQDIVRILMPIRDKEARETFIIMERLRPPVLSNLLISPLKSLLDQDEPFSDIDSELGIFGSILGNANEVLFNTEAGHVLRSKKRGYNEGGVSSGQGVIDSPFLY